MTSEDIAKGIEDQLRGSKLAQVMANQGPLPSFTMLFENEKEEQAQFTFQANVISNINPGVAEIKANLNLNVSGWRK